LADRQDNMSEGCQPDRLSVGKTFLVFLRLGLTSFGGPVAHLGYFREEFVARRKLLNESAYADLVALCQFLPGPASSQVGMGIGLSQAGLRGALAAWTGFTMPSAAALVLFALGLGTLDESVVHSGWLHGLKVAAVAVVALAVWGMARSLCPDRVRGSLAVVAAGIVLFCPSVWGQVAAIVIGGLCGRLLLDLDAPASPSSLSPSVGRGTAVTSLGLFTVLLVGLPMAVRWLPHHALALFDSFFRSGSLVFGGGHVVLPLLQAEVVSPGWVSNDLFLAGYGAVQAVPGPLFTFSAYLGAVMAPEPDGWTGALICLLGIFLPSFLLVVGVLPFWDVLRGKTWVRSALGGVNAAVVGLLLAAFYNPVWTSGILSAADFVLALFALALLTLWKTPPWLVVLLTGVGGWLVSLL